MKGLAICGKKQWAKRDQTRKPYIIVEIEREYIYDFKGLANKQNWEKGAKGDKVYLSRIRKFGTKGDNENNVTFRRAFDSDYTELCIKKTQRPSFEFARL